MYRLFAAAGGLLLGWLVFWRVRARRRARAGTDGAPADVDPADGLRETLSSVRDEESASADEASEEPAGEADGPATEPTEAHEPAAATEAVEPSEPVEQTGAGGNGQPAAPLEVERERVHERAREAARRMRPDDPSQS